MYSEPAGTVLFALLVIASAAILVWAAIEEFRRVGNPRIRRVTAAICAVLLAGTFALEIWPVTATTDALCGFFPVSEVFGPTGDPHLIADAPDPVDAESTRSCVVRGRTLYLASAGLVLVSGLTYWLAGRYSWRGRDS